MQLKTATAAMLGIDARQGNYSEPKDKPLKNRQTAPAQPANQGFADMPLDDDLPFI